jgi:hypothetical protein
VGIFGPLFFFPVFFPLSALSLKREEEGKKRKNKTADLLRGALESVEPDVLGALGQGADADDRGAAGLWCFRFGREGEARGERRSGGCERRGARSPLREAQSSIAQPPARSEFFCPSLFGPQCARSARANRHWRAADGPLEREIGTGCIQELKKCLETAALGKGKCKSKDCLLLFSLRSSSLERGGAEREEFRESTRGEAARPSILRSPCSLSRESLYPPPFDTVDTVYVSKPFNRTEGAALRWAAKATCFGNVKKRKRDTVVVETFGTAA